MENAITWAAGTSGHIFGLTVLLYRNDGHAGQENHSIKPLKQCLCNFKMVEPFMTSFAGLLKILCPH